MKRSIQSLMLIMVVVSLPLFWLFRTPPTLPARFSTRDCQAVALTDTRTGQAIIGVEDMALLPGGDRLILSAMDRLAWEKHPMAAPEGGLYEVSVSRLASGENWASPIVQSGAVAGGVFPHGVAVSRDGERLAFVNLVRGRSGEHKVSIIGGALRRGAFSQLAERSEPEFCRANDLEFAGDGAMTLRVTLDRTDCGLAWADLKPGSTTGRVISVDIESLAAPIVEQRGLEFANGISGFYVAETRGKRLRHRLDLPVKVPGGPDNLTRDGLGGLIVALHPNMYRFAAYLYGYQDTAPSRIIRVDLDRNIEVLFDEPSGKLFSGATVGVLARGILVAGSVLAPGVLVCAKDGSS